MSRTEYVFHRGGRPVCGSNFEKLWSAARAKAKVGGRIFHDYRRTAARNMIRAGVPQAVAMKITGHKTDSMFRRYNVVSTVDQADALRRQFDYLKGKPSAESNVAEFQANTDRTRTIG